VSLSKSLAIPAKKAPRGYFDMSNGVDLFLEENFPLYKEANSNTAKAI
jgi:hypothetical protein